MRRLRCSPLPLGRLSGIARRGVLDAEYLFHLLDVPICNVLVILVFDMFYFSIIPIVIFQKYQKLCSIIPKVMLHKLETHLGV